MEIEKAIEKYYEQKKEDFDDRKSWQWTDVIHVTIPREMFAVIDSIAEYEKTTKSQATKMIINSFFRDRWIEI